MPSNELYNKEPSVFQKYIALTTQKQLLIENIAGRLTAEREMRARHLVYVDVGCGDGAVTIPLAKRLNQQYDLELVCIEPSKKFGDVLRSGLPSQARLIQRDAETMDSLPRADFMLMSHLLYYIGNVATFLGKAVDALNPGGMALVVTNNPQSADSLVKAQAAGKEMSGSVSIALPGILADRGVRFTTETIESTIDASGCFDMNEDGRTLVAFLEHKNFAEIPPERVEHVRNIVLQTADEHGILTKKEDYFWLSAPER